MSERYDPLQDQAHESPADVFHALLEAIAEAEREVWVTRWREAEQAKTRLRRYGEEWDQSLYGVTRFGQ